MIASHERTTGTTSAQRWFFALVVVVLAAALIVTLIPRSVTRPPATLGIGAAQAQRQLEAAGIQFTTHAIADGEPSIGGSSPDGSVNLALTGTPTTLTRAVIIVSLPGAPDGNHPVATAGTASEHWMRVFFESVLPQWSEATAWWRANATTSSTVQTTVGSATVVLTARQTPSTGNWDIQTCVAPLGVPQNRCI